MLRRRALFGPSAERTALKRMSRESGGSLNAFVMMRSLLDLFIRCKSAGGFLARFYLQRWVTDAEALGQLRRRSQ